MQRCSHSFNTASVLRGIYLSNNQTSVSIVLAPAYAETLPPYHPLHKQCRSQSSFRPTSYPSSRAPSIRSPSTNGQHQRRPPTPASADPVLRKFGAQSDRRPKDEEIQADQILLVGDKGSGPPKHKYLRDVLRSMDRENQFLVQVGLDNGQQTANYEDSAVGRGMANYSFDAEVRPVCKIMDRKAYFLQEQGKNKKTGGGSAKKPKELELTWSVDPHDLDHRLGRAESFLADGKKVEIFIARKKRGKPVSEDDCQALIKTIKDRLLQGTNIKESKEQEGVLGQTIALAFENKS